MNKVQKKRLLNVAKSLRESKSPRFTMECFVNGEGGETPAEAGVDVSEKNFCGTPACALGHYGSRGDLQKKMKIGWDMVYKSPALVYKNNRPVGSDDPAVCEHFGITQDEAFELFGGDGCGYANTALEAAEYIERFVASK